jgi:predicted RNA-binding protein YlxR (DUF448 family)
MAEEAQKNEAGKLNRKFRRMCVGCGEYKPKTQLLRVAKSKDGTITVGLKASGKGAYVCKNVECLEKARKQKKLQRALSCAVKDEVYSGLETELEKVLETGVETELEKSLQKQRERENK